MGLTDDYLDENPELHGGPTFRFRGKLITKGLVIPPIEPDKAKRESVKAVIVLGTVECSLLAALSTWAAVAGMPTVSLVILIVVLSAFAFLTVLAHCMSAARMVRHARRWHTEPLYRQKWEKRAESLDQGDATT